MKMIRIIMVIAMSFFVLSLGAEGIADVHRLCGPGQSVTVQDALVIKAIVISDWQSPNVEMNPQKSFSEVDLSVNHKTVYVQSLDGKYGLRLQMKETFDNRLSRYDIVTLDLKGAVVGCNPLVRAYTVSGLTALNVLSVSHGSKADLVLKEKTIAGLTDEDYYTFVTLKDVDAVFKDGSWANVWEPFTQPCEELHEGSYEVNGYMDGWASLIRDTSGSTIYMHVNMLCPWRRKSEPIPQGSGTLSGVIVNTDNLRYGGDMGRYSIRPIDESDISMGDKSEWKPLTAWILDGSAADRLEFEILGFQSNMSVKAKKNDRIVNDYGTTLGYLWTDSEAAIMIRDDYNSTSTDDMGTVRHGAIMFKTATEKWFEWGSDGSLVSSRAFYVEFSPKKARKASCLQFNFEWFAGDFNKANANFPVHWGVECSIDGGPWIILKETATGAESIMIRALPWDRKSYAGRVYRTGYDCGMGPQQRSFALPPQALTASDVVVRLAPVSPCISRFCKYPSNPYWADDVVTRMGAGGSTVISFSNISIEYR